MTRLLSLLFLFFVAANLSAESPKPTNPQVRRAAEYYAAMCARHYYVPVTLLVPRSVVKADHSGLPGRCNRHHRMSKIRGHLVKEFRIANEEIELCQLGKSVNLVLYSTNSAKQQDSRCMEFKEVFGDDREPCRTSAQLCD